MNSKYSHIEMSSMSDAESIKSWLDERTKEASVLKSSGDFIVVFSDKFTGAVSIGEVLAQSASGRIVKMPVAEFKEKYCDK